MGLIILYSGCERSWDEYYQAPVQSTIKLWDAIKEIPKYSEFVKYMEQSGYDTIVNKDESFTLFIPTNDAFGSMSINSEEMDWVMGYHISKTVFIPSNIKSLTKLETLINKFALLSKDENNIYFDGLVLSKNSPLYKDGIYYELNTVAYPRLNLYEYMSLNNPIFTKYIDSRDSISLDYAQSKPLRYNDEGNTVYDSVFIVTNLFERDYYPVSVESRDNEATMLLVSQDQYFGALDIMATKLKGSFVDHNDIPVDWQTEFLIPYIFENGTFGGALEYSTFLNDSLENIQGHLIDIDNTKIDPNSRTLCSNGIVFQYSEFLIPEKLYLEEIKYEGEGLIKVLSSGYLSWNSDIVTASNSLYTPTILNNVAASGGSYASLTLPRGSTTAYSLEIKLPKIFPRKYKLVWRGRYSPSGLVAFYINGEYIGEFDNYNFRYPVNGSNPVDFFNKIEFIVDNITEYDDVVLKMEYQSPGFGTTNGLSIDYISLIPTE